MLLWVVIGILGAMLLGFAWTAGRWQQDAEKWRRRAEFWEGSYMEKIGDLTALRAVIEEIAADEDEGVLGVWSASRPPATASPFTAPRIVPIGGDGER